MTKVTWNGAPVDPEVIEQYGVTFPKGEAVHVPATHKHLDKFRGNPQFSVEEEIEFADETGYEPAHKGRGVWVVKGPNAYVSTETFTKEEAIAFADAKNAPAEQKSADETGA